MSMFDSRIDYCGWFNGPAREESTENQGPNNSNTAFHAMDGPKIKAYFPACPTQPLDLDSVRQTRSRPAGHIV